jgi:hypothetical protein
MEQTYLTVARQGRNRLKDYIVGVILIFSVTIIAAIFAVFIMTLFARYPTSVSIFQKGGVELLLYGNPFRYLATVGIVGLGLILGIFLAVQRVHKRKFLTLISPDESILWYRASEGFIVRLGIWIISFPIWYFINPARYTFVFNPLEWLPFALFSLVIVPPISLGLTLVYSYLLQSLGLLVQKRLFLIIVFALIFCLGAKTIDDLIFGILNATFISWIVLKDNRLDLLIGLMASRTLINMIFLSSPSSVLKLPTIIRVSDNSTLLMSLASLLLTNSLFYYLCFGISKNRPKSSSN